MSTFAQQKVIDTRTPLEKVRRTTLYRYLVLKGIPVSDNTPATVLRQMILTNPELNPDVHGVPDKNKIDEAWAKYRAEAKAEAEAEDQGGADGSTEGDVSDTEASDDDTSPAEPKVKEPKAKPKKGKTEYQELVEKARKLGVPNPHQMKKEVLLLAVKEAETDEDADVQDVA